MGRKVKNNSNRIKRGNKKQIVKRKVVHNRVDRTIADINGVITDSLKNNQKNDNPTELAKKMEAQSISFDELKALLHPKDQPKKKRQAKLSIDDTKYLNKLTKKWGQNYERMAKDVKLNVMQWTAHQIQAKQNVYTKMVESEKQQIDEQ